MLRNGTRVTSLISIVMASSFVVSSFVGSALAVGKINYNALTNIIAQTDTTKKADSLKSRAIGDSSNVGLGNAIGIPLEALKHLSKCESHAAADGDLKRGEVKQCYLEAFTLY
jgi:hypothetical protein